MSWRTWSDGSGSQPNIFRGKLLQEDSGFLLTESGFKILLSADDWGKIQLAVGEDGHSGVYDFSTAASRLITVTENKYGAGQGSATVQIRGQAAIFAQDDGAPAWETYTGATFEGWRYIQVRATK